MRTQILVVLLMLVSLTVNAKYYEGTIFLKNGEEKTGFIGSFMENNILKKLKPGKKISDEFNLNDATIKFRSTIDSEETIKISVEEIDEVIFSDGPHARVRFKPLFVGGVNKKGELELSKNRIWLPLLVDGKIKIYSYKYTQYNRNSAGSSYMHFIQHPGEDYAIQPLSELGLFQMKGEVITRIAFNEVQLLLADCPESYAALEDMTNKFKIKEERKKMRKKLKEMKSAAIRNFLSDYPNYGMSLRMFANYYWIICDSISYYNNNCE